jgi:hypothetical protein
VCRNHTTSSSGSLGRGAPRASARRAGHLIRHHGRPVRPGCGLQSQGRPRPRPQVDPQHRRAILDQDVIPRPRAPRSAADVEGCSGEQLEGHRAGRAGGQHPIQVGDRVSKAGAGAPQRWPPPGAGGRTCTPAPSRRIRRGRARDQARRTPPQPGCGQPSRPASNAFRAASWSTTVITKVCSVTPGMLPDAPPGPVGATGVAACLPQPSPRNPLRRNDTVRTTASP